MGKAKSFRIEAITEQDYGGGALRDLVGAVMVTAKDWEKHLAKLARSKGTGAKTCAALAKALGHVIPAEAAEWLDVVGPKGLPEPIDTGWYMQDDLAVPAAGAAGAQKALGSQALLLLTGLEVFGYDASGDRLFGSLRPHPLDVVRLYQFNHENGEVEDQLGASIAEFIVDKWVDETGDDDDDDDDDGRPRFDKAARKKIHAARKAFAKREGQATAKLPKHLEPVALWKRSHWLFGLMHGEPAFQFPEKLAQAPTFATWTKEKPTLAKEPQLAVYWMLAHLFLGDDAACREAAALAAKSKGTVVVEIAKLFTAFLDGRSKSPIAALSAAKLAGMREVVAKNVLPEQLGGKPAPGSKVAAAKQAANLVAEQDKALAELVKGDKRRAALVEEFKKERTDSEYNHWPYKELLPDWIVPAVATVWKSGLAVDLGHPKAYAGVTRAVAGRADHPDARAALIAALGSLAADDDRLEHVVPALLARGEPEAREAVRAAAWRWVDVAGNIDKVLAKREKSRTLDDMVAKDDLIQPCVHAVLEACDDEAQRLALAIAEAKLSFRVMKVTAGYIWRVYGARGIKEKTERVVGFLGLLDKVAAEPNREQVRLDMTASAAFAEASLALARLDPEAARARFREVLALERQSTDHAALAALVLPGLIALDPTDREALTWLQRLLGTRTPHQWLYGAYLAAHHARAPGVVEWLRPHAYLSQINEMMDDFQFLEATARKALAAHGAPAPEYDDTDEYANKVKGEALGDALLQLDRYKQGAVLDRIEETKAKEPLVGSLGRYLTDQLQYSKWVPDSHFTSDEIQQAMRLLAGAGKPGKSELDKIERLPDLADYAKEWIDEARTEGGN